MSGITEYSRGNEVRRPSDRPVPERGVRGHLVIWALVALLPAWGFAALASWNYARTERAHLEQNAQDIARSIADMAEREASDMRMHAMALAGSADLASGDFDSFQHYAARLIEREGILMILLDADGRWLLNTPVPSTAPLPQRLMVGNGISALRDDVFPGRKMILFTQPFVTSGPAGPVRLVIATDAFQVWSVLMQRAGLPDAWVGSILDQDSRIFARSRDAVSVVGSDAHPDVRRVIAAEPRQRSGWAPSLTRDGARVYVAWHRVAGLPWTVLVGVPQDAIDGALYRAMLPVMAAGTVLLSLLTCGAAIWTTRKFGGPLHALEDAATALGHGIIPPPIPTTGVRELDAVARAISTAGMERSRHEAERTALAARLEAVLESTTDSVLVLNRNWTITYLNGRACQLLGQNQDIVGHNIWSAFPDLAQTAFAASLHQVMDSATTRSCGTEWPRRGIWIDVDAFASSEGITLFCRNVTTSRQTEAALRESELQFRTLAEAVPQIVWSATPAGEVDYVNPRYFEYCGLATAEMPHDLATPIHPEDRPRMRRLWDEAIATGMPYQAEYRLRQHDGGWRWFVGRAVPARDAQGHIRRWIGTATDVTELIETRQALERQVVAEAAARQAVTEAAEALAVSEERFRRFAEASPDVLWIANAEEDRLDYISNAYTRIWGRVPDPRQGALQLSVGTDAAMREIIQQRLSELKAGKPLDVEYEISSVRGDRRWIRLMGFPMQGPSAKAQRIGGFARDITNRKFADERQKLLIAELNHRVKNTLATVQSLARQTVTGARAAQDDGAAPRDILERYVSDFQERLMALARAHDLLTVRTWRGATLDEVATAALAPWRDKAGTSANDRLRWQGQMVWLGPKQALALALALHELATNAAKHGALAHPDGSVALTWSVDGDGWIAMQWAETGLTITQEPTRQGFGTRLLRRGLPAELGVGSSVELQYARNGLLANIRFRPIASRGEHYG